MRAFAATLSIFAVLLALTSCGGPGKAIVGKWQVEGGAADAVWDFQANGTVITSNGVTGRYSFGDNNRLKIQTPSATFVHQLELQGDRMTWRDMSGGVTQLTRAK
ncbi:MAG TPA: hypothetical protein VF683_07935 [Chthoniobacterales bacterium]